MAIRNGGYFIWICTMSFMFLCYWRLGLVVVLVALYETKYPPHKVVAFSYKDQVWSILFPYECHVLCICHLRNRDNWFPFWINILNKNATCLLSLPHKTETIEKKDLSHNIKNKQTLIIIFKTNKQPSPQTLW